MLHKRYGKRVKITNIVQKWRKSLGFRRSTVKNFNTKNLLFLLHPFGSPNLLHSGYRTLFIQGVEEPEREGNHSHILQGLSEPSCLP
jgi:hypothetical protein